jgi:hypothetical protein
VVVHSSNPNYIGGRGRRIVVWSAWKKMCNPSEKQLKAKRAWNMGTWLKWQSNFLATRGPEFKPHCCPIPIQSSLTKNPQCIFINITFIKLRFLN